MEAKANETWRGIGERKRRRRMQAWRENLLPLIRFVVGGPNATAN